MKIVSKHIKTSQFDSMPAEFQMFKFSNSALIVVQYTTSFTHYIASQRVYCNYSE